jgi:signal transduction histidine kinase
MLPRDKINLNETKQDTSVKTSTPRLPLLQNSLSAKVLIFSLQFGVIAIFGISLPVIHGQSSFWLTERLEAAYLASLALEATPNGIIAMDLQQRLLTQAGVLGVTVRKANGTTLMIGPDMPLESAATHHLSEGVDITTWILISKTLTLPPEGVVHVIGSPKYNDADIVEVDIRAYSLRERVLADTRRSAGAAVFTSLLISIFFYIFLQFSIVQRLRRMTRNILEFSHAPSDSNRIITPGDSLDEIGVSEQVLKRMQIDVHNALIVRGHLVALGSSVTKILHDMRGLLSSALVISDTLENSQDPEVRRIAPRAITAIDRAVKLSRTSVDYARQGEIILDCRSFLLAALIEEVLDTHRDVRSVVLTNTVPVDLKITADRTHIYRVLDNLVRNSLEAGSDNIGITAKTCEGVIQVDVVDNGPGISEKVLACLFIPFSSSTKIGSTGLGLSITRDIIRAHGGEITVLKTGHSGTTFRLSFRGVVAQ